MLPFKKKSSAQHEVNIYNYSTIELTYNNEHFQCYIQVTSKC